MKIVYFLYANETEMKYAIDQFVINASECYNFW